MTNFTRSLVFSLVISACVTDKLELYNTRLATSDLGWKWPSWSKWEELSGFGTNKNRTVRTYQVCNNEDLENVNNWIRTPYILARGGKQIYIELEFSISRCDLNKDQNICKETFNIFSYEAEADVASSTFPPWRESPYKKIDTVAANNVDEVNIKTFPFGPVSRKGFYIAIQDQGACMAVISLRAYYHYCPEVSKNLVTYPRTVSDAAISSLVTVNGRCTTNAVLIDRAKPLYRCSSDGKWQIPTGRCECKAGYQANSLRTVCLACPIGTYKLHDGLGNCTTCPENSGQALPWSLAEGHMMGNNQSSQCPCYSGFARARDENITLPCSSPPSRPTKLVVANSNDTSAFLKWKAPENNGGREDIFYLFRCESSAVVNESPSWNNCSSDVEYIAPSRVGRYFDQFVTVAHLLPYRKYRLIVYARNAAFASLADQSIEASASSVVLQTNEAAPSAVRNIKVKERTESLISLTWEEPEHLNGELLAYEVSLTPQNTPDHSSSPVLSNMTSTTTIKFYGVDLSAKYKVLIRGQTAGGYGPYNTPFVVETKFGPTTKEQPPSISVAIVMAIICLLLVALSVAIIFRYRRTGKLLCLRTTNLRNYHQQNGHQQNNIQMYDLQPCNSHDQSFQTTDQSLQQPLIVALPPPGQRIYVDYPDPPSAVVKLGFEINPKNVKTGEVIGEGEFAEVCRGKLKLKNKRVVDVAVKRLKSGTTAKDRSNFLREASDMAQFDDPNVIKLKGVVTQSSPYLIVTEYMENNALDNYLRKNRGKLAMVQLVTMMRDISSGMRYLSNMKYVHRDLAARNILLDSNLVCKVSDFGLSRTLQDKPHATYTTQGGKIAIRWTALESLLYRKFTSSSDVWSYGIVMWEMMSYGEKPYWDMENEDVVKSVQSGMRLPTPMGCPEVLHDMMLSCWQVEPNARPTFNAIFRKLNVLIRRNSLLFDDEASQTTPADASHDNLETMRMSVDIGDTAAVQTWLKDQKLQEYSEQFKTKGIDNLEKVCNLTINDLKAMGIDVTKHIHKFQKGIKTLRRHLSSSSPPPSTSNALSLRGGNGGPYLSVVAQESILV